MAKSSFKNIWIFLPILNEAGNLESIVKAILSQNIDHLHIALIIDKSTDNTENLAKKLQKQHPKQVFCLFRQPPASRALAGIDAYLFCLRKKADVIIEMDADFSHHPKYIPQMLKHLRNPKVDVVLGSRFMLGGSDSDRSAFRTFVSKVSGIVFRLILGIHLTDMGSGYKAYKSQVIKSINPKSMFSKKGLAISMESIFRVLKEGFKVKEIPIIFKDRTRGQSKLSWKDFFEPVLICFKLVYKLGRYQSSA